MGAPSEVDDRRLALLADPTRSRILRLIRDSDEGRALVGELAAALELTQPTVSHHMKALLAEGFVRRHPEGRRVWYAIDPDEYDRVSAFLGAGAAAEPDLDRIVADLSLRFRGVFGEETIRRIVHDSSELLRDASASTPYLASRTAAFASARLDALARADGDRDATPEVLFVCVQNAGRSQLAAGILRHLAGDRIRVATAGSEPATEVRSTIIAALDEIGVPATGDFPKPLTDEAVRAASVVITMGCGDACPVLPGRRYLDWDLEDPAGLPLADVREIRDDIARRVRELYAELVPAA
ncbi:metalloregulator ArsR/SmtB family transcription factor [Microbacterium aquimaris]|uniref:metalloregulator ArsR/SmtB family transcription factor n=1 Tax=Microbacterium aquimaris TaxID=459816 RepID=UPI002AD1FF06|nr:metalloregulator ArsR/SmtB family transcription factor [Microbacterium aquimaris]MDZ8275568.1 metalloregulator ArsR/SmtB family transcription factor [Microbacterium aquimaris]